jgi:hypothetical protein
MSATTTDGSRRARAERGHVMAGVMVLIALMLIFSTIVFQSWEEVLRRDNEAEMIFRAEEIVRAMVRYKKAYGAPPEKLEQLLDPGPQGQYFLRRAYTDPLVRGGKWGLLYAGPGGQLIDPNAQVTGFTKEQLDALGVDDRSFARRKLERQSMFGDGRQAGAQQPVFQPITDEGQMSSMGAGRQIAGLRLAGVRTLCDDEPFRIYKGQERYSDWLFTWVDLEKPKVPGQGGLQRGRGQQRRQQGALGQQDRQRPTPGSRRDRSGRGRR